MVQPRDGAVLHGSGCVREPCATRNRPAKPHRGLRCRQTGRSLHERRLTRGADKICARPVLPGRRRLRRCAANALKEEYEAITKAGFILQIDAPDLGSARHNQYQHLSDKEFLRIAERNIAALNQATANIPPEAMRMHLCWGNYEGPHTHDFPLAEILDVAMQARPAGLSFEAANPRHAHEWEDLRSAKLPDDKILIP